MARLIFILLFWFLLIVSLAYAGDTHQDHEPHTITYTVTDFSGNPVSSLTPRIAIKNVRTGQYYDFSDLSFKAPASATTLFADMAFDQTGGFYQRIFTMDNATILISGDLVVIASLDDATYGDTQSESIAWSNVNNLIRSNR